MLPWLDLFISICDYLLLHIRTKEVKCECYRIGSIPSCRFITEDGR